MAYKPGFLKLLAAVLVLVLLPVLARAAEPIAFEPETLENGLRVIYAPLTNSPVVHVRVIYHVGSRDERPDRQGFAHMFEHMMFRGSAHVAPEEHMKTIGMVGGNSNAFTSFDETVYINTLPAAYLETALYLEADRMASFKVSPKIFATERLVVAQEWALRNNQPYGTVFEELLKRAFTTHPYRWTPIGNMDHLQAASAGELQAFFNKYYVPNNAILVIAGKIDVPATKEMVKKYYGWIPGNSMHLTGKSGHAVNSVLPVPVKRDIPAEPEQTEPRRAELRFNVPLARVMVSYPMPPQKSEDQDALGILATIVGDGRSSRLSRLLVTSDSPLCTSAGSMAMGLEDGGVMGVNATVLAGKSTQEVEKIIAAAVAEVKDKGVTAEELAKAKQQARIYLASRRETADNVASELGSEALYWNDPSRVNTAEARLEKITAADVQAVAKKYLRDERLTTLIVMPDPTAPRIGATTQTSQPATTSAPATTMPAPRVAAFPPNYPEKAPFPTSAMKASFEKGTEKTIAGVKVIIMPDRQIPLVNWSLTMRAGSDALEKGKEGLGGLTASMVRRGPKGTTYNAFNEELESRAISLEVSDGGDTTRISGQCLTEQFPFALEQTRKLLREPAFSPEEFAKVKSQNLSNLQMSLNSPTSVAGIELSRLVFGDTPLGRSTTMESLSSITLDDVKACFERMYRSTDSILMISGDVSVEDGQKLAGTLLADWQGGDLAKANYELPAAGEARTILIVDRPESKQSNVRLGIRAYTIRSDEKYAGSLASQILSSGIDSRLGKYVRAEKGLTYSVWGAFSPGRHAGAFNGSVDTRIETTSDAITAMFDVFEKMCKEDVGEKELLEAKMRVAGGMVMGMQTISQQASQRVTGILNDYPLDYYDTYAERIAKVTAEEIRAAMNKYVNDGKMTIVVVAPAAAVKEQLEKLGKVEVTQMPLQRGKAAATAP